MYSGGSIPKSVSRIAKLATTRTAVPSRWTSAVPVSGRLTPCSRSVAVNPLLPSKLSPFASGRRMSDSTALSKPGFATSRYFSRRWRLRRSMPVSIVARSTVSSPESATGWGAASVSVPVSAVVFASKPPPGRSGTATRTSPCATFHEGAWAAAGPASAMNSRTPLPGTRPFARMA